MKIKVYVVDFEMSPRARNIARRVTAGLAVALIAIVGGAIAQASVPTNWNAGDVLKAAVLNGNFSALDSRITVIENLHKITAQPGAYALVPEVASPATQFLMDASQRVLTLDSSGNGTISFTAPFPNGVLAVVPAWGDNPCGAAGALSLNGPGTWVTTSGFQVHASCPNVQVRITYIAVGW